MRVDMSMELAVAGDTQEEFEASRTDVSMQFAARLRRLAEMLERDAYAKDGAPVAVRDDNGNTMGSYVVTAEVWADGS